MSAYAAAWARRPAQAVEDKTDAKSLITRRLAESVAERVAQDPAAVEAAIVRWLPNEIRKQMNKEKVAQATVDELPSIAPGAASDEFKGGEIDDDWMNSFERFAEDASSDRMQRLWGRVLCGQIKRPGSFSRATLRFIHELDQEAATDFEAASPHIINGQLFIPDKKDRKFFALLLRLEAAGTITGAGAMIKWSITIPEVGFALILGRHAGLIIGGEIGKKITFDSLPLTTVGKQLLQIVPNPNEVEKLKELSEKARTAGATGCSWGPYSPAPNDQYKFHSFEHLWGEAPV